MTPHADLLTDYVATKDGQAIRTGSGVIHAQGYGAICFVGDWCVSPHSSQGLFTG